ncbi:MAG: hypothetical protein K6T63_03070 [Alicyclobacillus herbarius]|uniref:G1 family glutamic endopeptidase n=1 Tax=Alicyclobacillus herbarius TaxID=122960 RepID=UPI002354AC2E|nr:G1 family glutamic endopeptidase [Alicyclobacillus herbarius]MCL6631588.1 hypothetical protein [Alicyclobacillus herbarius]
MKKTVMAIVPAVLITATAFVPQASAKPVYMSASHKASPSVHATQISLPKGTEGSTNWAGYIATPATGSSQFTSITGSWVVPEISGIPTSLGSQWIGLGGVTSSDLLQMGTIEQFVGHREVVTLFWEKLPASAQNLVTVPIGSKVQASISSQDGSNWSLDFRVVEPGGRILNKKVSVNLTSDYVTGIGTSAEWISEDPSDQNGQLYPLANTGVVQFTQSKANGKPISSSVNQVHPVALVTSSGRVRIAPSALSSGGTSFSTINIGNQRLFGWNSHKWNRFQTKGKLYHRHLIR